MLICVYGEKRSPSRDPSRAQLFGAPSEAVLIYQDISDGGQKKSQDKLALF